MKYHAQFLLDKEKDKTDAKVRYRIKWNGNIVAFNLGYRIEISKWSNETQRCKANTTHGTKKVASNIINRKIQRFETACEAVFLQYDILDKIPSKEEFRTDFNIKIGREEVTQNKKSFFELYEVFLQEEAVAKQWTDSTIKKMKTVRKHLLDFDSELSFEKLNENKLIDYQLFLLNDCGFKNSTIIKQISFFKWFLNWASKKGFLTNDDYRHFKPKIKDNQKKIIFLTPAELKQFEEFEIPQNKQHLQKIKDIFIFQCYTGLRYSDVDNLKKSDIKENHIEVTTLKTNDNLIIEFNNKSKAIINKYSDYQDNKNRALPVITNQKTNEYLKELCQLAGIDEPVRITSYKGNERIDEYFPKYELIGTHAGRRTFICNALSLGIPPQVVMKWTGHSDYKAMKPYIDIADEIKANAMDRFNRF